MAREMRRIVYVSWPAHEITGGIKVVFRHVTTLQDARFRACVATEDGQPPSWFENSTATIKLKDLRRHSDVLVFPENHPGLLKDFASWDNLKVVFCQNQYMAFRGLAGAQDYGVYGVHDLICVGTVCAEYCRRRFPEHQRFLVPNPIDRTRFQPREPKRMQVAYMPRKRSQEAHFIQDLFRAENPPFRSLPWVEINGMDERKVAEVLGESAVYLSLCRYEALGLSALEALASGCVVAGFTGFGARDFTTSRNGFWVGEDDCIACSEHLGRAVRLAAEGGASLQEMRASALETARGYCLERFRERLIACWNRLAPDARESC